MGEFQEGGFQIVECAAFSSRGNLLLRGHSYLKSTLRLRLRRRVWGQICYFWKPPFYCRGDFSDGRAPKYRTKGCSRNWRPKFAARESLNCCKNQCSRSRAVNGWEWTPFCVILWRWLIWFMQTSTCAASGWGRSMQRDRVVLWTRCHGQSCRTAGRWRQRLRCCCCSASWSCDKWGAHRGGCTLRRGVFLPSKHLLSAFQALPSMTTSFPRALQRINVPSSALTRRLLRTLRYFRSPCDRDPTTGNFKNFKFFKSSLKNT